MRGVVAALAMAAVAGAAGAPANAAEPIPQTSLAQSGPWFVEYAADTCKLRRPFGTDRQRVWVEFEQRYPRGYFEMMLYGPGITALGSRAPFEFRLGDTFLVKSPSWMSATTLDHTELMRFVLGDPERGKSIGPTPAFSNYYVPGALAGADYLEIKTAKADLKFLSGPIQPAISGLAACVDDLVRGWGLDPAVQRSLSRPPIPIGSPGEWIRSIDFPALLLDEGRGGIVGFRVLVSAAGEPTGCRIQSGLSYEGFESATCESLMRRAHFTPALDSSGKPVASYYINNVRWVAHNAE